MFDTHASADNGRRRTDHTHRVPEARSKDVVAGLRVRVLRIVLIAAGVLAAIVAIAGAVVLTVGQSIWVPIGVAVGCVAVLIGTLLRLNAVVGTLNKQIAPDRTAREAAERASWDAYWRAEALQKSLDDLQREVGAGTSQFKGVIGDTVAELSRLAEQIRRGESPVPQIAEYSPSDGPYALAELQPAVFHLVRSAVGVASLAASRQPVAVLITLARRLQPLIHRSIKELDELERQIEDPDLLNALFRLDHLVTRARRQAESIAVLGGVTARQIRKPVPVYTVLRQAIAEIEHYGRVRVLRPVQGTVVGHAVTEIIHLIAELVENATAFSPPDTRVQVQVDRVPDGLSIEIDDLGLLMSSELRQRMNHLLAAPDRLDVGEQLKDGRIGLIVVAAIARRYKIRVRLERNERGGNRALVVLPADLLSEGAQDHAEPEHRPLPESPPAPVRASVGSSPVPVPARGDDPVHTTARHGTAPRSAPPVRQPGPSDPRPFPAPVSSAPIPPIPIPSMPVTSAPVSSVPISPVPMSSGPVSSGSVSPAYISPGPAPVAVPADASARPALPRRDGQHMAPELLHSPRSGGADPGSHNPGLLALYQEGRERAARLDPPPAPPTAG